MAAQPIHTIKIFFCYAHEDDALREQLARHLSPLRRLRYITAWFDRDIQAGTDWELEIEAHLDTANIILLLVSADFIASDYCYTVEMRRALERHKAGTAHVIPIILRPVAWEETPIGELSVLPTGKKPVTLWTDQDEAWLNVVRGIREVVKTLLTKQILSPQETSILYPELRTDKPNIRIELVSPAPLIGRQVIVHDPSISAKGQVEGLPSDVEYAIAGYVVARGGIGFAGEFGEIREAGFWNIRNIPLALDIAEQRLFFKIFDEYQNEVAKSEEIKIVWR